MSTYAQLTDMETWAGAPIPPDQAHVVQNLLDEAEVELEVVGGSLAVRIAAELTTADRVKLAVLGMVSRALNDRNQLERLLSGTSTGEERLLFFRGLVVTRRERVLIGLSSAASSVSLAAADGSLANPWRRSDWAMGWP